MYDFPHPYPCPFCEFIAGRYPFEPIVVNRFALAFVNTVRRGTGGILVAPRRHVETLSRLTRDEAEAIVLLLRETVAAVASATGADGCHTWCSAGMLAGQSVAHLHFQIQVRAEGVPYSYAASHALAPVPIDERRAYAARLREEVRALRACPKPPLDIVVPEVALAEHDAQGGVRWPDDGTLVAETAHFLVAVAPRMRTPGALVVTPRRSAPTFLHLSDREASELAGLIGVLARGVERSYNPDGLTTWWETGRVACQSFRELVVELAPRYVGRAYEHVDLGVVPLVPASERQAQAQRWRSALSELEACEQRQRGEPS